MAKEVITRCDKCGASKDVREIAITPQGDETKTVDLCPEHAGPIFEVYALGVEESPRPKPRNRRTSAHSVVPVEDLENWEGHTK